MSRLPLICAVLLGGALAVTACASLDEQAPFAGEGTAALSTERTSPDPVFSKKAFAGKKAEAAREAARGTPGEGSGPVRLIRPREGAPAFPEADGRADRGVDCNARCGADRLCLLLCDAGADGLPVAMEADADCLTCGRETGFRGGIVLRVDVRDDIATLTWTAVEGADDYLVSGLRWAHDSDAADASYAWVAESTTFEVALETGYVYRFQVTPRIDGQARPGLASKPVFVEP